MKTIVVRITQDNLDALHKIDSDINKAIVTLLQKCNTTVPPVTPTVTPTVTPVTNGYRFGLPAVTPMDMADIKRRMQAAEFNISELKESVEKLKPKTLFPYKTP